MSLSCSFFIFFKCRCSCCGSGVLLGLLYFSRSAGDIEFLCNVEKTHLTFACYTGVPYLLSTREMRLARLILPDYNPISRREISRIYWSEIFPRPYTIPRKGIGNKGFLAAGRNGRSTQERTVELSLPPSFFAIK